MSRARELLGPAGPLAARLGAYESRPGQLSMADAVEATLRDDGVLLCEAGTGTGKTFAYLVPALLSGRKVVISTATRALQDQIAYRDLPLVQEALGIRVPVAVMKGLGNYLCRRRHQEFLRSEEALRPLHAGPIGLMRRWIPETETGDVSELSTLPEGSLTWLEVASSSETRIGASCPHFDSCFVTEMKRQAEAAQVVVVNHHLFFADLSMRGPHPGRVLPDYDAVVLDEAHQIEDVATLFFGVRITDAQLARLAKDAARTLGRSSELGGPLDPASGAGTLGELEAALGEFWKVISALFTEGAPRVTVQPDFWTKERRAFADRVDAALDDLSNVCSSRATDVRDDLAARESLEQVARRCLAVREQLTAVVEGAPGRVTWAERAQKTLSLSSTPVDLSWTLRERLFESVPAVILTSATLSTKSSGSGGFSYVRARLGISDEIRVRELVVPSPFDFEEQALLYTPRDLPSPRAPEFLDRAAERIAELIELTDGGAFVLTTSIRSMRELHQRLRGRVAGRATFVQGERPKGALLSAFRAAENGVLVATQSFWEGVDVPGSALRLVVLEKVPFAVPTDPVVMARGEALERDGKSAFAHLSVPGAAINLKQGFGRLIRRRDDVGVVALLDERIHTKGYGKRLLAALPPAQRTEEFDVVRETVRRWGLRGDE